MKVMRKTGATKKKMAPVGKHVLSNVELTIYDGVDVASGCIRHA